VGKLSVNIILFHFSKSYPEQVIMDINNKNSEELVLIQITDLHIFTNKNEEFAGVNSSRSLQAVLSLIKRDFSDFDVMLATGDLVQDPEQAAYKNMLKLLSVIDQPIYYLPGNHDDPELMEEILGDHFVKNLSLNNWEIIFLNSYKPGTHSGYLKQEALISHDERLKNIKDSNILICLHHHPVSIESAWMDSIMLENPEDLFRILDKYDNVKGMIWGHIHQEFSQIRNNMLLMGSPSTCAQFLPHAKQFATDSLQPGYRWLKLMKDGRIESGVERINPQHYHEDIQD